MSWSERWVRRNGKRGLGRCESVLPSLSDPALETLQPRRKRPGVGISLQCVVRDPRKFNGAGHVADVETDIGAPQRKIGVQPWACTQQRTEPPSPFKVACGRHLVTTLVVRERYCRVRNGPVDRVVEVSPVGQPARLGRPALRISPIAKLDGSEHQIPEREDLRVGELGSVSAQRECIPQYGDRLLRPAQQKRPRPHGATGAEQPSDTHLFLICGPEFSVAQHLVDAVRRHGASQVRECRAQRRCLVGGYRVKRPPLGGDQEPSCPGCITEIPEGPRSRDRQLQA